MLLLSIPIKYIVTENLALQQQYDRETKNSIDVKKQLEWNNKIAPEIKKLQSGGQLSSALGIRNKE